MQKMLFVGFGGFIGTCMRYGFGGLLLRLKNGASFPYETLVINVLGCLAIGFLAELVETRGLFTGTTRTFLSIGVIGGFTTFSTFGYETIQLLRSGQRIDAVLSVTLQVVLGLGAVWAGTVLSRMTAGGAR
jgi:fluoride exporter